MKRGQRRTAWIVFCLSPALAAGVLRSDELTLEWILDPESSRALQAAHGIWLTDEVFLLDTPRRPEAERGIEALNARTVERKPAGDKAKVLEAWKGLVGEVKAPKWVGLPSAASSDGKTLLYARDGDLFLLDLESSALRRVANTEAPEEAARLSPDGRWLAYVRENDLHAAETATLRERRLTRDGGPTRRNGTLTWVYWEELMDRSDEGTWWSPDSSALLYLQTDESPVSQFPIVDHEPVVPRVRWQRYPKAGGANPSVRAGIVELEGGETRWIDLARASPDGGAPEYVARGGWVPGGKAAALETLNRAQNRLRLFLADRSSGEARLVHEEASATWVNLHHDLHFLPGGERFLWVSERGGHRHLYLQSVKGEPPVQVTSGEWVLRQGHGAGPWKGSVAWIDFGRGTALYHAARPVPFETQVFRTSLEGKDEGRISEGEGTHAVKVSPGGSYFVDEHSRSGAPPRLTLHRSDGTLLSVIEASATDRLAGFGLTPPQLFTVPADDGTPLPARLFRPAAVEEGKRCPAIVYVYGGPGAPAVADRWDGTWYLWSQLLAKKGYAVFTVDPRSASDQGKAREDSVHRKFYGDVELKDILAGVRHLKSLPFVDPERVGIWGWSGGGTSTVYAMTRSKEFRAGIEVAGVADQRYYDTIYTERYMGRPEENEDGYRLTASAAGAADLHGRLLIVHGTGDDNVHVQNALRLADALIAAGKPFDLMLYPGRGHGIGDPAARKHLFRLMLEFWERNLKG
ncbi:MAG: S9 family peptidase [Planctomycetes bacterium]|nr:S9 family peptidase [Planctomycetota bacterium]